MSAPFVRQWFGDHIQADERRDLRAEAVRAATYLHGEFQEQAIFRDDELESVLSVAERVYQWITAPEPVPAEDDSAVQS